MKLFNDVIYLSIICLAANNITLQNCSCFHQKTKELCEQSPICQWSNNQYCVSQQNNDNKCQQYYNQCRLIKGCMKINGKCIPFTNCSNLTQDQCNIATQYCIFDGLSCIDINSCENYLTFQACSNLNLNNGYCYWQEGSCHSCTQCSQLPKRLNTHKQCQNALNICTNAIQINGCKTKPNNCYQLQQEQCETTLNGIKCIWFNDQCIELKCTNIQLQFDQECKQYLNCTSNGITCIERTSCENANKYGCTEDKDGKQCYLTENEKCVTKACQYAPTFLKTIQECSQFFNNCTPKNNGGCKIFQKGCTNQETKETCESEIGCIMDFITNKCRNIQCNDAPPLYSNAQCKSYLSDQQCIQGISGCINNTLSNCSSIQTNETCEDLSLGFICYWKDNQCQDLNCQNYQSPDYSSEEDCQSISKLCTYDFINEKCTYYKCDQIIESNKCTTDAFGQTCFYSNNCIQNTCSNAPKSNKKHDQCYNFLKECTVKVIESYGQFNIFGCTELQQQCKYYFKEQCYITQDGKQCQWSNNQCIDYEPTKLCSDAPNDYSDPISCNDWKIGCVPNQGGGCQDAPNPIDCSVTPHDGQYDTHEKCQAYSSQCTVNSAPGYQYGCQDLLVSCANYVSERQCVIDSSNKKCSWIYDNTTKKYSCVDRQCNQYQGSELTNYACSTFLSNCAFNYGFISRECKPLQDKCSDYTQQYNCFKSKHANCTFYNGKCRDAKCSDLQNVVSEAECILLDTKCGLKPNTKICYDKPKSCNKISQADCSLTLLRDNGKCYYDGSCKKFTSCDNIITTEIQVCQFYNSNCYLLNGKCSSANSCSELKRNQCNDDVLMFDGSKCHYENKRCRSNKSCKDDFTSESTCNNARLLNGNTCKWFSVFGLSVCLEQSCSLLTGSSDEECFSKLPKCKKDANNFLQKCKEYTNCSDYNQTFCPNVRLANNKVCKWDGTQCRDQKCEDNTTIAQDANQDENCNKWQFGCIKATSVGCSTPNACNEITNFIACKTSSLKCQWQYDASEQKNQCQDYLHCAKNSKQIATELECQAINNQCTLSLSKKTKCTFTECSLLSEDQCKTKVLNYKSCRWDSNICKDNDQNYPYLRCEYKVNPISNVDCLSWSPYCQYQPPNCVTRDSCSSETVESQCNLAIQKDGKHCSYSNDNQCIQVNDCSDIKRSIKNQDCYDKMSSCYLNIHIPNSESICKPNTNANCFEQTSPFTFDRCKQFNPLCYLENVNQSKCINVASCEDCLTDQQCCFTDAPREGLKCVMNGLDCITKSYANFSTLSNLPASLTNCKEWSDDSVYDCDGKCIQIKSECSDYTSNSSCTSGSPPISSNPPITSPINDVCFYDEDSQQWDKKSCEKKIDANSDQDCFDWLVECSFEASDHCQQIQPDNKLFTTHTQCYKAFSNLKTVVSYYNCQALQNCTSYSSEDNCKIDPSGNKCFWKVQTQQCIDYIEDCSIFDSTYNTHQLCEQALKKCTVNSTNNGCVDKQICSNYTTQQQCVVDSQGIECIYTSLNCKQKTCTSAFLSTYSNVNCQNYLNNKCAVNTDGTGCIENSVDCSDYNEFQCPDSLDSNQNLCVWSQEQNKCKKRDCSDAPTIYKTTTQCQEYWDACIAGGCKVAQCEDFSMASDESCQLVMPNKACTTNGQSCVNRKSCADAIFQEGCTFSIDNKKCEWINNTCLEKSCSTAPNYYVTELDCQLYLKDCTSKSFGGCVKKSTCTAADNIEACTSDIDGYECIWDYDNNKCHYSECISICGDGIVSYGEDCDDQNSIPYDGCYNCEYSCQLGCGKCIKDQCVECQGFGWYLIDGVCQTQCGDGIVAGSEQCDDKNEIQFDGCDLCQYQCDQHCSDCFEDLCSQCTVGYHLDRNRCNSKCGDGHLIQENEECDDGNLENGDGCSSTCQIEEGKVCLQSNDKSETVCLLTEQPKFYLEYLDKSHSSIQKIQIKFSQLVKYKTIEMAILNISNFITIEISDTYNYELNYSSNSEISNELQNLIITISITFFETIQTPTIHVTLQNIIVNQYEQPLSSFNSQIKLQTPYCFSEAEKATAKESSKISEALLFTVGGVSIVVFLLSQQEILWNFIDLIQYLSYLKYINIEFSELINIYFGFFDLVSMDPLLELLNIDFLLKYLNNGYEIRFVVATGKFSAAQVNANFIANYISFIVVLGTGLIYYILTFPLLKLTQYISFQNKFLQKIIYSFENQLRSLNRGFIFSGLIRLVTSSFLDLQFTTFLSLQNYETQLDLCLSIFAFIQNTFFIYFVTKKINSGYNVKYECLYEGVCQTHKWQQYFRVIDLIKKTIFMVVLTLMQITGSLQTLLLSLISITYLSYLLSFKPISSNGEFRKELVTEVIISFNTMTFIFYQFLNDQQSITLLSWIQISTFSMIFLFSLISDIYDQKNKVIGFCKRSSYSQQGQLFV